MGLTERAGGGGGSTPRDARQAWEASMARRLDELRRGLKERDPHVVAALAGARGEDAGLELDYWGAAVHIPWPEMSALAASTGELLSVFDRAMLLYYLHTADGAPLADRWISFRELPDGGFYHQAFQGYSGDLLARRFGEMPQAFEAACRAQGGWALPTLAPQAFAFQPLPRLRLAVVLWPGDEDFASRAMVLFDGAAHHYLPTDGLALLGSGLTQRLLRAAPPD